jgi:hypothetical protein
MKFVSKNNNLTVVLMPGIPAQPLSGTPARAGLYVRFKQGSAEITDEKIIDMLKNHPAFNADFICVEDNASDPFMDTRRDIEPTHVMSEMKYGHLESTKASTKKVKLTPEIRKVVDSIAMEKVKELLPGMVEAALKQINEKAKAAVKNDSEKDEK